MRIVKTKKAKQRINTWLKEKEKDHYLSVGKSLLIEVFEGELPDDLEEVLSKYGMKKLEELFVSVGGGYISPASIKSQLQIQQEPTKTKKPPKAYRKQGSQKVLVSGMDDLAYRLANCCSPVSPDKITGYITQGLGITVHKQGCSEVDSSSDRVLECSWI